MMHVRRLIVLLVALAVSTTAVAQPKDPAAQFNQARRAYGQKRYRDAIMHIGPLLYPSILLQSEEQIIDAHKVLAVSYFMIDDHDGSRREFMSLLGIRPDYVLDPSDDPAAVTPFFEVIKRELEAARIRQAREEERQRIEEERRRIAEALARRPVVYVDRTLERVIDRRATWPLLVPFGYGQRENGQRRKAWAFFAAETTLLAASVTAWSLFTANQGRWSPSDKSTITALNAVQLSTGGAFLAVAVWGILDALAYAPPRETTTIKDNTRPPSPAPRASVSLAPGGLVLRGEF